MILSNVLRDIKFSKNIFPEYTIRHGFIDEIAEARISFEAYCPATKHVNFVKFLNENKIPYNYQGYTEPDFSPQIYTTYDITLVKDRSVLENRIWEIVTNGIVPL